MTTLAAIYRVTGRFWWEMSAGRVVALIALLTAIRFFVAANAGLLWDEPYYWMWSRHLAAGYYDHPPMVAWWIATGTALFGDTALGLRSLFVVNTALTSLVAFGIGKALFGPRIGVLAAVWTNVVPLLGIAGMMATPDGPSVLFWTLAVLAFAKVVETDRGHWWLAVGVAAGLGLLSKYTNLFLGLGIVLALVVDARLRRWFASPWLWAGGLVAAAIFLPVVLWNAANDWISFRFQFGRLGEARFTPVYFLTLLLVQPLIFNPYAAVFVVRAALVRADEIFSRPVRILFATCLPAAAFIAFQSLHGEVLQHWLAPVFPTLTTVAVAAASVIGSGGKHWLLERIRTDAVPFALFCAVVVWLFALLPLDRYYPGNDPLNSVRGWPAFAGAVEDVRSASGAGWIATTDYATTAQLSFELASRDTVVPVTERQRYGFLPAPPAEMAGSPALVIIGDRDPLREDILARCFIDVVELEPIERRGAGEVLGTSRIFRGLPAGPHVFTTGCDLSDG